MAFTVEEVLSRAIAAANAAGNFACERLGALRILHNAHMSALYAKAPNLIRRKNTDFTSLTVAAGPPPYLDISTINPLEILSVGYATVPQAYKEVQSREEWYNVSYGQEANKISGFWFPAEGAGKILIYQGSQIKSSHTELELTYVRRFNDDYMSQQYTQGSDITGDIDCPDALIDLLVQLTVFGILQQNRSKLNLENVAGLDPAGQLLSQQEAAIANQLKMLEQQNRDLKP